MTLLRGIAEGVDLQGFLQRIWAAKGAVMDPETVELGATLGALESLLGGCTTQLDMYVHHEAAHRGAVAAGSRHVGGPTFFSGPGPDGLSWEERMAGLRAWPRALDRQRWRADGIRLGIGTDGCASSNDLDMWQAMRQAAHPAA